MFAFTAMALVAAHAQNAPTSPRSITRLQAEVILDAAGFEQPMAAMTLFIPYGWRSEGGVFWGTEFLCTNGYAFNWRAVAADGLASIAVLPGEGWNTNNFGAAGALKPGCKQAPITDIRAYLQTVVQRLKPGARILAFQPRPDIAQTLAAHESRTPTAVGESSVHVEAGQMLFAYSERGTDMRGFVDAAVIFTRSVVNSGSQRLISVSAESMPGYAATAPNGSLNFAYFEALRRTAAFNPQWVARIAGHNGAIAAVAAAETQKRMQILRTNNEAISRLIVDGWNQRQQATDTTLRQFSDALRDVQRYGDEHAAGGEVALSNRYSYAWRLADNSYVLSDDAAFDPRVALGVDATLLAPTR